MIRFLLLVFLALGGGAFGDTQVFDILNNLCLQCELSFEHCYHLDQHFTPSPDRFLAKKNFFRTGRLISCIYRVFFTGTPPKKSEYGKPR